MRKPLVDTRREQHIYNCQATNVKSGRFCIVTRPSSFSAPEAQLRAYRVERPRASDAIAVSLRDAFERESGIPEDMVMLLRSLNRLEVPATH
ncbi:hypothetical protein Q9Q95_11750 [Sphingomonas sp. DG1-23]|uniref:hypothetical protein n=1 Tax=Sphingomonas sp. DG1-23 TaxID=3068316 RepID=UPI00273DFC10|nr:hypothetical protein [Sphingomonas sp. DG1-23]MDP5279596.1 hypothetical protein [Sphingomonas sp. DG1-23]